MLTEIEIQKSRDESTEHITRIGKIIDNLKDLLNWRAKYHDYSKLRSPELSGFAEYGPKLKTMEYMSNEYKQCLSDMKPFLDHHYSSNRHHPEYHKNGISDMSLIDILEMLSDWKASVERSKNGDIFKSLEINTKRFNIPTEISNMMKNTLREMMPISIEIKNITTNTIVYTDWGNTMEDVLDNINDHKTTTVFTEDYDIMERVEEIMRRAQSDTDIYFSDPKPYQISQYNLDETEYSVTLWRNNI